MNNCQKNLHPAAAEFILSIFPFHIIQIIAAAELNMWLKDSAALIKIRNQLVFRPLLQTEARYLHLCGGRVLKFPFYPSVRLPQHLSQLQRFQLGLDLLTL